MPPGMKDDEKKKVQHKKLDVKKTKAGRNSGGLYRGRRHWTKDPWALGGGPGGGFVTYSRIDPTVVDLSRPFQIRGQ